MPASVVQQRSSWIMATHKVLIPALLLGLSIVTSPSTIVNRSYPQTPDFQDGSTPRGIDTSDKKGLQEIIRRLTSPALEQRKKNRREYQQRHYAEILYEMAMMDVPGALLATARSQTQLELQLPSAPLTVTIPVKQPPPPAPSMPGFTGAPSPPWVIPLFEDRRFPADPWSTK